jgi:quinol monooxygenase YgiN
MTPRRSTPLTQGNTPVPQLLVVAHLNIAAGEKEAVLAALPKLITISRTEPGNISFEGFRSLDNPRHCLLVERFVSRAAFDEHLASPHYKELALDYIVPRLEGRTIEQFDVPATEAE